MNVLFVCTGNTCRSPMAAALMNQLAAQRGLRLTADSAGLAAFDGAPASEYACLAVQALGGELSSHRSKPVTNALIDWADAVICMTDRHCEALLAARPDTAAKLGTLNVPIPDPYGQSAAVYRRTAETLLHALEAWLAGHYAGQPAK